MAFMTHASWDFPADARGYSYGVALRALLGRLGAALSRQLTPPQNPNQLPLDFRFFTYFGEQPRARAPAHPVGMPGAVKLLGYRNQVVHRLASTTRSAPTRPNPAENAAACTSFNYGSKNATAPDLCWVRKPNVKLGIGIDIEQSVTPDDRPVPARRCTPTGKSEVDAYNSADRSFSFGAVAKGTRWGRPFDLTGIGLGLSWASPEHARYLAAGGIDGFIGDGALSQATEGVFEIFYSLGLFKAIWLSADFQLLWNPGYNADRGGPLVILGARAHAEF